MEQTINLHNADCWETLKTLPDGSVHTIITDPPYDIGFMGKDWDKNSLITNVDFWKECLRVLKSGGYLLSFGHSRTSHRMASAIENAGFEIRDTIMWIYGSGFPKSHNVALSIDKKAGAPNRGKAIPVASTNLPTGKYADEKLTGNKVDDYEAKTEQAKGLSTANYFMELPLPLGEEKEETPATVEEAGVFICDISEDSREAFVVNPQ